MFWDAVVGGLKVLTHWQTYVAGLEYLANYMIPMAGIGFIMQSESKAAVNIGCLPMVLLPILQVAALIVFVLTLGPIILGISDQAAWAFPFQLIGVMPFAFLKLVGVITVAAFILAFVSIFGRFQSLHTLLLGALTLAFVLTLLESTIPGAASLKVRFWPGFWFLIGLLVGGVLMSWVGQWYPRFLPQRLRMTPEGWLSYLFIHWRRSSVSSLFLCMGHGWERSFAGGKPII